MLLDKRGIDHHADRDEEHCAKDVPQRRDQMLDLRDLARFSNQRAREKCAERD